MDHAWIPGGDPPSLMAKQLCADRVLAAISLDTHVVTINWGDGSPPQTATVDELRQTFAGSHQYSHGGTYTVTVTVTDSDGAAVSKTMSVKVTGNNSLSGGL